MPVVQVTEAVRLAPNSLYVIPPGKRLTLEDETLKLVEPQQAPGARVAVYLFFRDLAANYGQRAVSIVLSGADSDGAIGLKHIAVLAERNRMAQELHDTLAQGYTGVKLQAAAAEMAMSDDPAQILPYLTRIREIAQGSMQEARQAIRALCAPVLNGGNLPSALRHLAEQATDGVKITFKRRGASAVRRAGE